MTTTPTDFKGTLLLCDSAQALGDKLYILGGGWARVIKITPPLVMALAVRFETPWHETNRPHKLRLALMTQDGKPAVPPDAPVDESGKRQALRIEADFEVGRPPGTSQGSPLVSAFAATAQADLDFGAYRWELSVDRKILDTATFEVVPPPGVSLAAS